MFGIDRRSAARSGSTTGRSRSAVPRDAIRRGIYLVPEDRKRAGLVLDMPIRENISLADLLNLRAACCWSTAGRSEGRAARRRRACASRRPSIETQVVTLSGGNQQKVVLAKWLAMQPRC